jgi:hypothetical protein
VYDAATAAAGEFLNRKSPVRGAYVGVGVQGKLPGRGSPGGQVGATCGWTIDDGAFANVNVGVGVQERTRDPRTGRYNSGWAGIGGSYGWSEGQGWGAGFGAYCGQSESGKKKKGGGHGGFGTGGFDIGINYGPVYGGIIVDPLRPFQ